MPLSLVRSNTYQERSSARLSIYIRCYVYRHKVYYCVPQGINENFQMLRRLERCSGICFLRKNIKKNVFCCVGGLFDGVPVGWGGVPARAGRGARRGGAGAAAHGRLQLRHARGLPCRNCQEDTL